MNYSHCIKELEAFDKFGIKLGLDRIKFLLASLGNPEKKLKSILIGGTNGKGSVCAMLSSILFSSGYSAGMFTSPHLLSYTERIRLNEKDINKAEFVKLFARVKKLVPLCTREAGAPTIFEILTAMAILYFARKKVDIAILEVGLGGRYDSVNAVMPVLSVITNIDLEHTEVLGKTLAKIAFEKAGIIKPNIPVVTAVSQRSARNVILNTAKQNNSRVVLVNKNSTIEPFKSPLFGKHQIMNTAVVLKIVEELNKQGLKISAENIRSGLSKTRWPGRFQIISRNPLIILDGAHNPAGAKVLRNSLTALKPANPLTLILGIQNYKNIKEIVNTLTPLADKVILTRSSHKRAALPDEIKKYMKKRIGNLIITSRVSDAIDEALRAKGQKNIVIAGSIFTVADALKKFIRIQMLEIPRI